MSRNSGYIMVVENTPERTAAQERAWQVMYERELAEASSAEAEISEESDVEVTD
jgi:hypothetical protein